MMATAAEPTADIAAKCSVTLGLDTETKFAKCDVVATALVQSSIIFSHSSEKKHIQRDS